MRQELYRVMAEKGLTLAKTMQSVGKLTDILILDRRTYKQVTVLAAAGRLIQFCILSALLKSSNYFFCKFLVFL
jgi:hypothetical protein